MSNTLTDLYPDLYAALDVVSRELVGLIPAVTIDSSVNQASLNQDVVTAIVPSSNAAVNISAGMSIPSAADQVIGNAKVTITKSRAVPFSWDGSEQNKLNSGGGYLPIRANQIVQAMRTLVNEVETDLAGLQSTFSRSYGTAAQTPFATANDFTDMTKTLKILKDNGAPVQDNHLVVDTSAGATFLGKQAAANTQGTDSILRQGVFASTSGVDIRESAQIVQFTKGTGASATTNTAGYAIGATVITLASAGTGTIIAGDSITFAGDTNQYMIASGDADVSNGGTITLAAPGLRKALAASAVAITLIASSARNMLFNRSAIILATRLPERPKEGDLALDVMTITDPRSGLTFEVSIYGGYRMVRYEIALAWGVKNIKPEHTAILLG